MSEKISFHSLRIQDLGGFENKILQQELQNVVSKTLLDLKSKYKTLTLLTGLNLGIETWSAENALLLKIPYIVYVPFDNPSNKWPKFSQDKYNRLITQAQQVKICDTGSFSIQKMRNKEEQIIKDSTILCLCYPRVTIDCKRLNKFKNEKRILDIWPLNTKDEYFINIRANVEL